MDDTNPDAGRQPERPDTQGRNLGECSLPGGRGWQQEAEPPPARGGRQEAKDRLGSRFDLKEFHGVVLSNGSMPLEVLERVVRDYIEAGARG